MTEQWKDIPGYAGLYEASNLGTIRRKAHRRSYRNRVVRYDQKVMKPVGKGGRDGSKYLAVCLTGNRGAKLHYVHRLILETFVGQASEGLECRHLDGNPHNNRLDNLAWGSRKQNMDDRAEHSRNGSVTFQEAATIRLIMETAGGGRQLAEELADEYGCGKSTIYNIVNRKGRYAREFTPCPLS